MSYIYTLFFSSNHLPIIGLPEDTVLPTKYATVPDEDLAGQVISLEVKNGRMSVNPLQNSLPIQEVLVVLSQEHVQEALSEAYKATGATLLVRAAQHTARDYGIYAVHNHIDPPLGIVGQKPSGELAFYAPP